MDINYQIKENGDPEFTISGISRETFCMFLNGSRDSQKQYSEYASRVGLPCAGRNTEKEFDAYMAELMTQILSMQIELRNSDADSESVYREFNLYL